MQGEWKNYEAMECGEGEKKSKLYKKNLEQGGENLRQGKELAYCPRLAATTEEGGDHPLGKEKKIYDEGRNFLNLHERKNVSRLIAPKHALV